MKKHLLLPILLLVAAASWAFYPKPAELTGYMMIIGSGTFAGFTSKAEVTVVDATGHATAENVDVQNKSAKQVTESMNKLHVAELQKLNEYKQQGWQVVHTTPQAVAGMLTTTYLLEKR